jgi:GcrA cell cycle regulator
MSGSKVQWNDALRAWMLDRWIEGQSATEIACAVSRRVGVRITRNTALGQIKRMEKRTGRYRAPTPPRPPKPLAPPDPISATGGERVRRGRRKGSCETPAISDPMEARKRPKMGLIQKTARAPDSPTPLTFDQMIDHRGCKWEVTGAVTADAFRFCGMPREPGRPWCAFHAEMAGKTVSPEDVTDE